MSCSGVRPRLQANSGGRAANRDLLAQAAEKRLQGGSQEGAAAGAGVRAGGLFAAIGVRCCLLSAGMAALSHRGAWPQYRCLPCTAHTMRWLPWAHQ